jgi:hypothetical protein
LKQENAASSIVDNVAATVVQGFSLVQSTTSGHTNLPERIRGWG